MIVVLGPGLQSAPRGSTANPCEEVEITVAALKKGNSAGVDNIPAKLVQADGESMIDVLTKICSKIWKTGE